VSIFFRPRPMADTAKDGATVSQKKGAPKAEKPAEDAKQPAAPTTVDTPEDCARTVVLFGCLRKSEAAAIRALWPNVEAVQFSSRKVSHTAVVFKTPADAEAAAKVGMTEIAGKPVRVAMKDTPEQHQKRKEQRLRSVLLFLPTAVTEEDLRVAFPGAETAFVHVSQKGAAAAGRTATVTFRTMEEATAAVGRAVEVKGAPVTPMAPGTPPPGTTEPPASKPAKKKRKKAAD